ncbi:hypothetical protein PF003_g14325 [Phytophthora fragariae]|nr:hypothetical protein PF003_g14325 [Phytophthora fragariae]
MLLCQFHVISYLEKKVVALCDGSQEHKQALKDIFAAMVIEAKWAKLKDLIRPSASVYECLATLLGLQGICENEYEVELNKIGTFCLPNDDEYQCMDKRQLGEIKQLANMVSMHAFDMINAEFKAALRVSTSYKICIRQDSVVELLNEDEKRQHLLSLEDFTCSCIFSQTQLLPCRHAFYYRRSTIAFAGTQFESIIPFKISTQDRDGTERCQKAIRKFEHDSGMILHDDDEIEEVVVVYVENYDILKAKDVATMVEFHKAHSILKKVERAMDWVSSLKDTSIMIGFDEFSACDKVRRSDVNC